MSRRLVDSGCIEWTGAIDSSGYGSIRVGKSIVSVHRYAYEKLVGIIPDGFCVLHKCNNPKCSNPDHLYLGTHLDNMVYKSKCGRVDTVGENNPNASLTEQKVKEIKDLTRYCGDKTIADIYHIHVKTVGKIRRGVLWSNVR